jgi:hypothetical protein
MGQALRPDEDRWLAVPVTYLYDRGVTVITSPLLQTHIMESVVILNPEMAKTLMVGSGDQVDFNGTRLHVRLDASVPASVVLVPRSMGVPIHMPVVAKLKKA